MAEEMKLVFFNVDRGFSCFIRTPSDDTILMDCGCREDFSPADYILRNELSSSERNNEYKIKKLVVSHPHDDHICDIENVHTLIYPEILLARKYTWNDLKDPDLEYPNLDYHSYLKDKVYTLTVSHDELSVQLTHYFPSMSKAEEIDSAPQAFLNNTSILSTVEFGGKKFLFTGDVQSEMWEELLSKTDFKTFISGTTSWSCFIFLPKTL